MSKRQRKFALKKRDFYRTPAEAVEPLLPFLMRRTWYAEPCAGAGDLIRALDAHGHRCVYAADFVPKDDGLSFRIEWGDAREYTADDDEVEFIITNPPWSRGILHELIIRFSDQRDTWLLFDADWMHTQQAVPYLERCVKIVSVGRVSWMQNGVSGFDNCCWYLFRKPTAYGLEKYEPTFYARQNKTRGASDDAPAGSAAHALAATCPQP